jgi:hypothetical protein
MQAIIPFDLYPLISRNIIAKQDLISLSVVSPQWRTEVEGILWKYVTLHYDDPDGDNINKLDFLIIRGAAYVRHLDIDYAYEENANRNDAIERSKPFLKAVQAISHMDRLERIDIYCNGDMAAALLSPEPPAPVFSSFKMVHTVKYLGSCSPPLYRFLRSCSSLRSLRFSSNLEPTADYSLIYSDKPSEGVSVWNALTTFSGNVYHVAAILRSPTASGRIKHLTIHLQPTVVTIKKGFSGLSPALGIETLGIGDFNGYPPFTLDHVLRDLSDAMLYFPNVRRIQRAPYYERMVGERINVISMGLRYSSLYADYHLFSSAE